MSRSFNAPARRSDTALATLDLNLPVTPLTAFLVGAGWSYLSDETLGDGGGGAPYWRLGFERGLGSAAKLRATVGQMFGTFVADARLDLELAPRTRLLVGYEQGLRTRFDEVRTVLTVEGSVASRDGVGGTAAARVAQQRAELTARVRGLTQRSTE